MSGAAEPALCAGLDVQYCLLAMDRGFAVHRDEIAADHQLIVDALRAGDAAAAGEIIENHILTTAAEVIEQVRGWSEE